MKNSLAIEGQNMLETLEALSSEPISVNIHLNLPTVQVATLLNGLERSLPSQHQTPVLHFLGDRERFLLNNFVLEALLNKLRQMFDLVVIHSGSVMSSTLAQSLYSLMDGSVIVVEAERTRIPVIKNIRSAIEQQGGRVLGTALNNRKFYIPEFSYSFVFG